MPEISEHAPKLWFKAKKYGYGWTPVTWQGWAVLLGYLVYITLKAFDFAKDLPEASEHVGELLSFYVLDILMAIVSLLLICYLTGEKPKWRWGK